MEFEWIQFSPTIQKKFETAILTNVPFANIVALSSYMKGLLIMKYPWKDNLLLQQTFYQRIITMFGNNNHNQHQHQHQHHQHQQVQGNAQGLANIIHSLGKMKIQKEFLSTEVLNAFYSGITQFHEQFTPQHISNICYG